MRATPLVVNRLPALEEVLGGDYPGFYDNLEGASRILNDVSAVRACHEHLASLDPAGFSLDAFLHRLQNLNLF